MLLGLLLERNLVGFLGARLVSCPWIDTWGLAAGHWRKLVECRHVVVRFCVGQLLSSCVLPRCPCCCGKIQKEQQRSGHSVEIWAPSNPVGWGILECTCCVKAVLTILHSFSWPRAAKIIAFCQAECHRFLHPPKMSQQVDLKQFRPGF